MTPTSRKNLLATIAYFDAMDYPLTTFELWRHLMDVGQTKARLSLAEIIQILSVLKNRGWISGESGFWFLLGREQLVAQRIRRQKISMAKIKQAKRWAALAAWLPYVQAIFLTGTLAMKKSDRSSDWDALVVTRKKRIWLGRFVVTTFLFLVRRWRHREKVSNRFCLNHFISEDGLILEERNEFTAKEISFCVPLLGIDQYRRYQQLNAVWRQRLKPNYEPDRIFSSMVSHQPNNRSQAVKNFIDRNVERFGIGEKMNSWIKQKMIERIRQNPLTYKNGADIRYNDQALVFLPSPQRKKILHQALRSLTEIAQ